MNNGQSKQPEPIPKRKQRVYSAVTSHKKELPIRQQSSRKMDLFTGTIHDWFKDKGNKTKRRVVSLGFSKQKTEKPKKKEEKGITQSKPDEFYSVKIG